MEGIRAFRLCHNMVSDINPDRTPNQGILGFPADHDGRSRTRDRASVFASSSPCESLPFKRQFNPVGAGLPATGLVQCSIAGRPAPTAEAVLPAAHSCANNSHSPAISALSTSSANQSCSSCPFIRPNNAPSSAPRCTLSPPALALASSPERGSSQCL